eukprot:TRINITY_DN2863_c3_g2_i1.p1 TRINITY_DN2863_c3_g2~~TRINITY_DN2863_c3_g2_i1.p1  ORF type:complete len:560 (+),score=93.46 TRINITY_DN2863_c3_g2_i1:37-1680(+)
MMFTIVFSLAFSYGCENGSWLTNDLLVGYNKLQYPPDLPVNAKVTASVTKINELNTKQQTFRINMYFRQQWVDRRLSWDPVDYCGAQEVPDIPSSLVWLPDSFFANANEIKTPDSEEFLRVSHTGVCLWSKRIVLTLFCSMDFVWYPFDEQKCETAIESYAFGPDVMRFIKPDPTDRYNRSISFSGPNVGTVASYELSEPTAEVGTTEIGGNLFSAVTFFWNFRRKKARYILTAFSQIWLICLTSFVGCFVNPEAAPARVAIALISLLTIINLLSKLTSDVPVVPYITAMDVMYLICVTFVVSNVLEYCTINFLLTLLKRQETSLAELKKKRAGASKSVPEGSPTREDMLAAETELREVFTQYLRGTQRNGISKDEARSLVKATADERGRTYDERVLEGELGRCGEVVTLKDLKEIILHHEVLAGQLGLTTESRCAIILCGRGVSRTTVESLESVYRLWSPLLYIICNIVWFAVLIGQSLAVALAVSIPLVILYVVGLVYTVRRTFFVEDSDETSVPSANKKPSFKMDGYLPMEELTGEQPQEKIVL